MVVLLKGDGAPDVFVPPKGDGAPDMFVPPKGDGAPDVFVPPKGDGAPGVFVPPKGDGAAEGWFTMFSLGRAFCSAGTARISRTSGFRQVGQTACDKSSV
ncbi:MAG: hypothetical protein E7631_08150 [Ruminococcaceae bacterium]|nr:hypothetical protein [Oscillospiraceae bacterium]